MSSDRKPGASKSPERVLECLACALELANAVLDEWDQHRLPSKVSCFKD
jgi:hypothetical protein